MFIADLLPNGFKVCGFIVIGEIYMQYHSSFTGQKLEKITYKCMKKENMYKFRPSFGILNWVFVLTPPVLSPI